MPRALAARPAEDVAAADDDGGLHAQRLDRGDFVRDAGGDRRVDAVGLVAHQGFTRQLQQDALVGRLGGVGHAEELYAGPTGSGFEALSSRFEV